MLYVIWNDKLYEYAYQLKFNWWTSIYTYRTLAIDKIQFKGDNYTDFHLKGLLYRISIKNKYQLVYAVYLFIVNKVG